MSWKFNSTKCVFMLLIFLLEFGSTVFSFSGDNQLSAFIILSNCWHMLMI